MTISPPANVKLQPGEPARVLASGVDTLTLALDVEWRDSVAFHKLAELKSSAIEIGADQPGIIRPSDGSLPWLYNVKPYGGDGYEWMLTSGDMTLKIGQWLLPRSRPSIMAEIRSEALWTHGPRTMVERLCNLLGSVGGDVVYDRVSRVDVCTDVLLPTSTWGNHIVGHLVKRASAISTYFQHDALSGIQIGRGSIVARFYDKPLEIRTKSHKDWMFNIWGIESVPKDHRVIRVEFQMRRQSLKELGINTSGQLLDQLDRLWAYCSREWLKVQDDPSKHHTQQTTLDWWQVVQNGIDGSMHSHPLIRAKAISRDGQHHTRQIIGHITSLVALWQQGTMLSRGELLDLNSYLGNIVNVVKGSGMSDEKFTEEVKRKQGKKLRAEKNYAKATRARQSFEVSSEPPPSTGQ